nr:transglycosylase domain-containing protein [Actinomycetota bacterium]
ITQQYVKNTLIAPGETAEKTIERKIDEAALARQLEKKLTKDEILERYLNTVYFGHGAYGIQAAAKTYFGKGAHEVTLGESATLAGLVQAPENYDPFDRKRAAKERRDVVLAQMLKLGYIDETEKFRAQGQGLGLQPEEDTQRYPAPYFVDYVRRLIKYDPRFEAVGRTPDQREQQLFQGGLRIYTTVDLDAQAAAEAAVAEYLPNKTDPHASVVSIEPETGEIKAMVGGRDFFAPRKKDPFAKLNLATPLEPNLDCERNKKGACATPFEPAPAPGSGRQAGSAFKAFALVAAIEAGIPLSKVYQAGGSSVVIDGADNGADYVVNNYEGSAFGEISLLEATVNSVNVVYALLGQDVGVEKVTTTADEMGINTPLLPVASAPLGTNEINPLDMASGYATLATNGEYNPPVAITKIIDPEGKVLYEDDSQSQIVVSPAAAYLTTTALEQVVQRGTGTAAQIGRPVAGKTGTAQEYRDAWFVGYTPQLATAVWVGYPEGQIEMKPSCSVTVIGEREVCRPTRLISGSIGVTGGSYPAIIWNAFMEQAMAGLPVLDFQVPNVALVTVTIDTRTTCLANKLTPPEYKAEATFAAGTEPDASCVTKKSKTSIPDVFSFPIDDATRILEDAGFNVSIEEEEDRTYPPGRVIGQSPSAGTRAPLGSTVRLTVSIKPGSGGSNSGNNGNGGNGGNGGSVDNDPDTREVPNVLGMHRDSAIQRLQDAGFRVRLIEENESRSEARKNPGEVWQQSPGGGTQAEPGSTVTIWANY